MTSKMEYHVLCWTGSPSEDRPSVSNVNTVTSWTTDVQDEPRSQHPPGYLPGLLAEPYGRPLSDAPSAGHAQPPGLYYRSWQPSVYTMAYLGTHMCLTHGQTVSGPIALAGLIAAHH